MRTIKRLMQFMLIGLLLFTSFTTKTMAEDDVTTTWEKVDDIAAAAASGKSVAITMTTDNGEGIIYVLPTAQSVSTGPTAIVASQSDGDLVIEGAELAYGWTITSVEGGYTITNDDGDYLYIINSNNNGVRINTDEQSSAYARIWNVSPDYGYLSAQASDATRYLGVYLDKPDWRCYKNTTGNTANQKLEFWTIKDAGPVVPVESVAVEPEELELEVGQNAELAVTVLPSNATNKKVTFASSDEEVASVDAAGKVTALAVGTATIAIASKDDPEITATCAVTVVPSTLVEKEYGLVSTLETGDEVIVYNAGNGRAVDTVISNYKIVGVDVEPVDGVITTTNTDIVWTVTVNEDETVTFTQGDYVLGGLVSGTHNNLVVTDAAYTNWTLNGPDRSDFTYYLSLPEIASTYGPQHLEYYDGFTLYGSDDPTTNKAAYGMTFYKEGAEPETPADILVESIALNKETLELEEGKTEALVATVLPADASNKEVTWSSSDEAVATVENGLVTAVAAGTATITVATTDGTELTATCLVTVTEVSLDDLTILDKFTETPKDGSTLVIYYPVKDVVLALAGTTDNKGNPILSDTAAYWVQDKFILTEEMAYLTVSLSADGDFSFTNAEGKYLTSGETGSSLFFAEEPSDYSLWTMEQQEDGTWLITNKNAKYNGTRPQLLEYYNGFTTYSYNAGYASQYKFELYGVQAETPDILVESLSLDKEELELEEGRTAELIATVLPNNATNPAVTWSSSDEAVATVENGLVTAVAAGTATITVATTDGTELTATCLVTVTPVDLDSKTLYVRLTEEPVDGDLLVIYYPQEEQVLTATASGNRLAGVQGYLYDEKLEIVEEMAILSVAVTEEDAGEGEDPLKVYSFINADGKYLTSGETGNSLTFADEASDYSLWTLEQQEDGTWYVINKNAVYNGNKQALEYYFGFTTYGVKADNYQYKFEFYGEETVTPPADEVIRLAGTDRIDTAIKTAKEIMKIRNADKLDAVVLTYAWNFPDALSGSYLSAIMNAPILLIDKGSAPKVSAFIKENLKEGGPVFVLGGEAAVSNEWLSDLAEYPIIRYAGDDRFGTNLEVLEAFDAGMQPILVCSGWTFADSLSAGATGYPLLLVSTKLTDGQKAYLANHPNNPIYIIGGPSAVNEKVESEIREICSDVMRLAGANRYETSSMIAEWFFAFQNRRNEAVLAYAWTFPDGLASGPLGFALDSPILLVDKNNYALAQEYCNANGIKAGYIMGGPTLVTDGAAVDVFGLTSADEIVVK